MNEFNNRITAQRKALKIVNGSGLFFEPLLSLTEKAIDRWSNNNRIDNRNQLVMLLKSISENLFFLANKSQEQVTEDYKILSEKVNNQLLKLKHELENRR
ncbi:MULTISPECIES: hypothetical protein [Snodgrassella]|jgi:esterase/lipase|uniref:Uncharacterized protein n=1 Tax=Snodgrassella alvi TaxID=1196083 RepID=A0A2N9XIN5_9NEIS|nr:MULTISPECIES: hypothetical protein [Snodgrassella]PIT17952.1 hypothetical protein BGI33_02010 [Snodgrassella alvi]PIT19183.1 hypothetical protein BGI34_03470 [Snodgrassella alvi]PIT48190.1 hypothetical protein BHC48_10700 [Snodgrassella communis]